jgi:hypothetical protein
MPGGTAAASPLVSMSIEPRSPPDRVFPDGSEPFSQYIQHNRLCSAGTVRRRHSMENPRLGLTSSSEDRP